MLANKLNYGDTIGVVGVANSLELGNRYDDFKRAEELLKSKGFKIKMEDILLEYTKEYKFPIIKCNDFGHQIVNGIIPIGVKCKIDSDNNKIEILDDFLN